jgi:O-antigen/teichoic acid export membrane protein
MNIATKVAYNTIIQIISKIIATILGVVSIGIMTRYLGQIGFGQYTTILTFVSFFAIIADFGLTLVTVQMISPKGVHENKIFNNIFTFRLISALFFLSLAPIVILFFPYSSEIKVGVAIAIFSFLFIALNQVFVGLFQKKLRMDKNSIAEVVSRIVLVLGSIAVFKYNYGLMGIVLATVISSGVNFLIHYLFSFSYVKIKLEFDLKIWKEILEKSWPIAITIFFNLIYLRADILILSLIKTQAEVGIYGATYKIIDVLITVPFMFVGIILPVLTASWVGKNIDYFKKVIQKCFDFMAIIALPMVVGTYFIADRLMIAVAGNDFYASGQVLKILIIASGVIFIGTVFSHVIIAVNKQKKIIGAYIFTSLSALVAYFIFIPKFSYMGAAWVTIYSEITIAIASFYYAWKFTGFLPNLKVILKSAIASGFMGIFIFSVPKILYNNNIKLLLLILISIFVYFFILYILKGIRKKDIKIILNKN